MVTKSKRKKSTRPERTPNEFKRIEEARQLRAAVKREKDIQKLSALLLRMMVRSDSELAALGNTILERDTRLHSDATRSER